MWGVLRHKHIAAITEDFSVYRPLVEELRARNLCFVALSLKDAIPINVGVVITTEAEFDRINFDSDRIVVAKRVRTAVDEAQRLLGGVRKYDKVIIGIDPGKYPGIAVVADEMVISVHQVSISRVGAVVQHVLGEQSIQNVVIRIGHGARLARSQIINMLLDLGIRVELVDESFTTPHLGRGVRGQMISDVVAAINIASLEGIPVSRQQIEPSKGEIRVIQEQSRERSNGQTTIPRKLARQVARGELALEEAILCHAANGRPPVDTS